MFTKQSGPTPFYTFSSLDTHAESLSHAVFTRDGGVSEGVFSSLNVRYGIGDSDHDVTKNRELIQEALEKNSPAFSLVRPIISANQTHSDHIFSLHRGEALPANLTTHVNPTSLVSLTPYGEIDDVDAFVTDRNDIALMIQTADCQAVILFDPFAKVLGVVHSGWKGSVQNIIGKTVGVMRDDFDADPSHIFAAVGPSIGPCCHEFSDPRRELPENFHQYISGDGAHVDFLSATRDQLVDSGVSTSQIEFSGVCTADSIGEFYSHRREQGKTGRFATVAALA